MLTFNFYAGLTYTTILPTATKIADNITEVPSASRARTTIIKYENTGMRQ